MAPYQVRPHYDVWGSVGQARGARAGRAWAGWGRWRGRPGRAGRVAGLSPACYCLLLPGCRDVKVRPSALQALEHPWLQGTIAQRNQGKPLAGQVVQRLQVGSRANVGQSRAEQGLGGAGGEGEGRQVQVWV